METIRNIIIKVPAFMMSKDLEAALEFNKLLIVDIEKLRPNWYNLLV